MKQDLWEIIKTSEDELQEQFQNIDALCFHNTKKVLDAFHNHEVSEIHFHGTTGYGYNDIGRDTIEKVFASIFECEDALVRSQFISGSHALNVTFFALLRPSDTLLSITGKPYDTLDEVIGLKENNSSLASFQINYDQIDLKDNDFDYDAIKNYLTNKKPKVIEIQRSKGYSTRKSITIDQIEKIIPFIKELSPNSIIMIDNCYCEMVSAHEPTFYGADICVGSLIKNLGGGIASNGAYVAGKKEYVELVAQRLTLPGEGREVGPSAHMNKEFLQGIYFAPSVVAASLKTATLTSKVLEKLGYDVEPKYNDIRADIVQNIIFHNKDKLISFTQGIQKGSAIDAKALCIPSPMPGYDDEVIMASGSFTQGSSIEISCDGPIREPYIAYMQGSLTYEYGKLALYEAISNL